MRGLIIQTTRGYEFVPEGAIFGITQLNNKVCRVRYGRGALVFQEEAYIHELTIRDYSEYLILVKKGQDNGK